MTQPDALRSGRKRVAVSGGRSPCVAEARDSAFARGQENTARALGQQRQPEEDRLVRCVPQRRSDCLPAGIDGAGVPLEGRGEV